MFVASDIFSLSVISFPSYITFVISECRLHFWIDMPAIYCQQSPYLLRMINYNTSFQFPLNTCVIQFYMRYMFAWYCGLWFNKLLLYNIVFLFDDNFQCLRNPRLVTPSFPENSYQGEDCWYIRYIMIRNLLYQSFSITEKAVFQFTDPVICVTYDNFALQIFLSLGALRHNYNFQISKIRKK